MILAPLHTSWLPAVVLLAPLLAVPLILLSSRRPNVREFWSLAASVVQFALAVLLLQMVQENGPVRLVLFKISAGVDLELRVDYLGIYFGLIAAGLWILTTVYSIGYMRGHKEAKQTRYFASFALSIFATLGVAFAGNLLTFVLFYEVLTLATYPLVIHKETPTAVSAARQYLAYSLSGGLLLTVAAAWIQFECGTTVFQAGGIEQLAAFPPERIHLLFGLLIAGVGVKAALMPLHSWLPNAMVAPTPVSALLHAVAVVKSGVFGLARVVGFVLGPQLMAEHGLNLVLLGVSATTIVLASVIALQQESLKRRLAYSTIAHLSYVALGLSLLTPEGMTGGLLHISTHATMKITLFFCAGAIYVHAHKEFVPELDGIGRAMPWTMGAFAIGSIGLIGMPPVNGFLSKWFLCIGTVQSGHWFALAVLLVSGLLNAAYFLPIVYRAFFKTQGAGDKVSGEASAWMVAPLCMSAAFALVLGLFPNLGLELFTLVQSAVDGVLPTNAAASHGAFK